MVLTLCRSTSKPRSSRSLAASDITTTRSASLATSSRTDFWWGVGFRGTVWATTIDGTVSCAHDLDHVVAVDAAVDAVLVLDHRDVALAQQIRAGRD